MHPFASELQARMLREDHERRADAWRAGHLVAGRGWRARTGDALVRIGQRLQTTTTSASLGPRALPRKRAAS